MKVLIAYPALAGKGSPMLTQNRQFQWYTEPSFIYPVVPAYGATLLRDQGFDVLWYDGIATRESPRAFFDLVAREQPDLVVMETKTPVVRRHWDITRRLKEAHPRLSVALMGDHVTALPEETLAACPVDFVITGGDFDFAMLSIARHLRDGAPLEPGIGHRAAGDHDCGVAGLHDSSVAGLHDSGVPGHHDSGVPGHHDSGVPGNRDGGVAGLEQPCLQHDLEALPWIDRRLTRADLYGEKWRKRTPFFYTMVGRDCHWGKCSFCAWTTLYPEYRTRSAESLLEELEHLVRDHDAREVFDDSGSFPTGDWLVAFCEGMIRRGLHKKILFSCNKRFDPTDIEIYRLMKRAGFRKVKMGLESANQQTLNRLRKGITVDDIRRGCRAASKAGLDVHLTVMVGFPWETRDDVTETIALAESLMARGHAEMLQATVVMPYPGTPLHAEVVREGLMRFDPKDYDRYDMTEPAFDVQGMSSEEIVQACARLYRSFFTPRFMLRQLLRIRSLEDLSYAARGVRAVAGHIRDFVKIRG